MVDPVDGSIAPSPSGALRMTASALQYGRKYQKGLTWVTAIAMTGFHIGAVAAFFFIDAGAILTAVALYVVSGMLGIGMA